MICESVFHRVHYVSQCTSLCCTLSTCNTSDIVKAASTTQREIMYLICECYLLVFLTEKSICGDVLYHIISCLSAIEIMLKSVLNVYHQWRWRSVSTLVVTFECCIKSIFHDPSSRHCCCEVAVTDFRTDVTCKACQACGQCCCFELLKCKKKFTYWRDQHDFAQLNYIPLHCNLSSYLFTPHCEPLSQFDSFRWIKDCHCKYYSWV